MLYTSITQSKVESFLKNAEENAQLGCQKIQGFYLLKRGASATWYYRYTDHAGKRRKVNLGKCIARANPQTIAQQAAELQAKRREGLDPALQKEANTAAQLIELEKKRSALSKTVGHFFHHVYMAHKLKSRAGKESLAIIRVNFEHLFDRQIESLTASDIREWEAKRKAEGVKHATLKRDLGAFKAMLNFAAGKKAGDPNDNPIISENPISSVLLAKQSAQERDAALNEPAVERRMLTEMELVCLQRGLFKYADKLRAQRESSIRHGKKHLESFIGRQYPHWFVAFGEIALWTGARPGDLRGLRWEKTNGNYVDFERKEIVFIPEKTRDHRDPAKVIMPMSNQLKRVLKRWHEESGAPCEGFVFPNKSGERLDKKAHRGPWEHVKELGGLPDNMQFYSLRHHFISSLVVQNVPLLHIAKLVGHKSNAMIEENYGHLMQNHAVDIIDIYSDSLRSNKASVLSLT